ncbi:hypothetical protein G7046_g8172 [Stylonectria norvegica]|nr:hypothetical protein G7046_g8172 [Stylonectria norvegica]
MITPLVRRATAIGNSQTYREDVGTPVAVPYVANITPRSGSRQSRAFESPHTTPCGTPNPERTSDGWSEPSFFDSKRQSSQGDSPGDTSDSKFFYASDVRVPQQQQHHHHHQQQQQQPSHHQRPPPVPQKPATFLYANGATAEAKRATSPPIASPFVPMLGATPEPSSSKFFYANGTPTAPTKHSPQPSGPPSVGSTSSRIVPGRSSTSSSIAGHGYQFPQRPMSPVKMSQPSPPILKSSAMPLGTNTRPQLASPPPLAPPTTTTAKRRVSIESAPRAVRGHARTGSVPAMDLPWASPKYPMSPTQQSSELTFPPATPGVSQPAMTMASLLQAVEDLAEEDKSKNDDSHGEVHSPTKSTHSLDPISELVTNARRERKVQDLEITNASLEAINRTLERQLRKQNAEIRRYRRLSRAGRLSLASATSSRVPSETLSVAPINLALSDLSEEEDSAESEDEEPDSLDDTDFSGTDSDPTTQPSDKIIVRRKRDERRLQLDLSKHRELLVDSQKINQSLKRCLNWTEVLIKEGQKALEYKVRVSDVDFGGHVLAPPDEDEDDEETSQVGEDTLESYDAGLEPPWEKGSQDRDSGIELPADGG